MPPERHIPTAASPVSRRDPAVLRLALAWRDLAGGRIRGRDHCRRTVLACSGGGDSCGLVVGLAAGVPGAASLLVIAHIVHDLRPREEALADRDAAARLAEMLGLRFVEASVAVREAGGNLEAAGRRLRYHALARLADASDCHYIATAHHAQDQLETMLMGLMRGAGPRGLRGIAPVRRLAFAGVRGVKLIRPALQLERADLRRLCEQSGIEWREDATNRDTTRLRAAIRRCIIPQLDELRPGAALRASRAARLIAANERVLADRIAALLERGRTSGAPDGVEWPRDVLRQERAVVIGGVLRAAASELWGERGEDRLGSRRLSPIVRSIRDDSTEPRRFELGDVMVENSGGAPVRRRLLVSVTARNIKLNCMEC